MKIVFVIPGTKIKFLENAQTPLPWFYGLADSLKDYCPRKGDELLVSQVYIRKNGWFESSLTFRAVGGPIMDLISNAKIALDLEANKKFLATEEAIIAHLDSIGENINWYVQRHKIEQQSTNNRVKIIEEFSGVEKKTSKELKSFYMPTTNDTSYLYSQNYNRYNTYYSHYDSKVWVRSEILEEIKKLKKKISKPPAQGKINLTFRVSLKDIETWEVEIER